MVSIISIIIKLGIARDTSEHVNALAAQRATFGSAGVRTECLRYLNQFTRQLFFTVSQPVSAPQHF